MHESLMTDEQLSGLAFDVNDFFAEYKGRPVSVSTAKAWFERRGHVLTRPIEITLQVYGCVVRPADYRGYAFPMRESPWVYERGMLRVADLPKVSA